MALKPCKECGKEISSTAQACPHCGKPLKQKGMGWGCLSIACLGTVAVIIVGTCSGERSPSPQASNAPPDHSGAARRACIDYVTVGLKAPSTAKFQPYYEARITNVDDTYTVTSYVDAQNSFGAQLRTYFTCKVKYGSGRFLLLDLKM